MSRVEYGCCWVKENMITNNFFSFNFMSVLGIIFTNDDLKTSLMDYIVLSKLPTQQAGSKTPIVQIC